MRCKRGVSPVIATVLMLVITFVLISIVALFVVPFVRDSFGSSEECFSVVNKLKFDETIYNCYVSGSDRTGFSVRVDNENIQGFKVALFEKGKSDTFDIIAGVDGGGFSIPIRMLGAEGDSSPTYTLEVPQKGGVRTYVAEGEFERIELFPILSTGDYCDVSDSIEPSNCLDSTAQGKLTQF